MPRQKEIAQHGAEQRHRVIGWDPAPAEETLVQRGEGILGLSVEEEPQIREAVRVHPKLLGQSSYRASVGFAAPNEG